MKCEESAQLKEKLNRKAVAGRLTREDVFRYLGQRVEYDGKVWTVVGIYDADEATLTLEDVEETEIVEDVWAGKVKLI